MARLAALLLRLFVTTIVGILLAGAALTFAAERVSVPRPVLVPAAPQPKPLVVPDVQGQAYVFAKGILQDNGYAWHVSGLVQGFASNTVVSQDPAPGTVLVDTGAPAITLTLERNPSYQERGTPDNNSPYPGTLVRVAQGGQAPSGPQPRIEPVPLPVPVQPVQNPPTVQLPAPATTTPKNPPATPKNPPVTPVPVTPAPVATTPSAPATPAPPSTPSPPSGAPRPPDFTVPGAPKEPAQLQPLPDRALTLSAWLDSHRQPTAANLNHWLYEHSFIVAGAKFGWWHGAAALQILIGVDQRAEKLWGVGKQAETTARAALAEVQARAK